MKTGLYLLFKYFIVFFLITELPFLFTNYIAGDWDMVHADHLIWGVLINFTSASVLIVFHYYRLKSSGQQAFTHENVKINQVRIIDNNRSLHEVVEILKGSTCPKFLKVKLKNGKIELNYSNFTAPFYNFFLEEDKNNNLVIHFHPTIPFTLMDFGEAFYRVEQVARLLKSKA